MTFEYSFWLYTIPLLMIALVFLFNITSRARKRFLQVFTSEVLADRMLVAYSPLLRSLKNSLLLLGIALIACSLARPQWGFDYQEVTSKGIDIVFALDTSKSMLAEDIRPNRLERAKLAILDFVNELNGDRVGLIAFAGSAFLQCPPTLDYNAFKLSLEAIDTDIIATGGTDLAAAVSEASSTFTKTSAHKILILITDGEDLEGAGQSRALKAKGEGITIYTVGVGTSQGEIIPLVNKQGGRDYLRDTSGNIVKTRLDEEALIRIASTTDGFYVPLGPTGEGLREIYTEGLGSLPKEDMNTRMQKIPLERFQWPLGLALVLLLLEPLVSTRRIGFKRRQTLSQLSLLALLLYPSISDASPQEAYKAYEQEDYAKAAILYGQAISKDKQDSRLPYNQGASAYQAGDYGLAEKSLRSALKVSPVEMQDKVFYNLGNTRFQQGEKLLGESKTQETIEAWEDAINQYENALELNPGYENASHNLEYVKERLEKLKQEEEQKQEQQQEEEKDQKNDDSSSSSENDSTDKNSEEDQQEKQSKKESSSQDGNDESQSSQSKPNKSNENNPQEEPSPTENGADQSQEPSQQQADESTYKQEMSNNSQEKEVSNEGTGASSQQQQSSSSEKGEAELSQDAMTRQEARKLLDSLKDSEKKLPVHYFGNPQNSSHDEKPKKNW